MSARKILSAVLALVMVFSCAAFAESYTACPEVDWSQYATAADNGIELPELEDGVLKITVNSCEFNISSDGTMIQQLWEQAMEHYLGVEIEVTYNRASSLGDMQSVELTNLATDEIADINTFGSGVALNKYGEDGVVLNLTNYEDYMYYYKEYIATNPNYHYTADGSSYMFWNGLSNVANIQGSQSFCSYASRFDVLEKLGLTPATTIDELTALCEAIQAAIDDGTIDATYVMMNSCNSYAIYRGFVGTWRTWDDLYWNGSEWAFGPIEDNFRDMLVYLNGLYEAGYIDPEIATTDWNGGVEKGATGYAVIVPTLWSGMVGTFNSSALADSGIKWGLAYLPDGEYGTSWKWGSMNGGKSFNNQYLGIFIDAGTANPEYAVAMVDYQYSDEIVQLMNWGVEGVTYTVNADGTKSYVDAIMNAATPGEEAGRYGIMSSSYNRTGIPWIPIDEEALLATSSQDPWWAADRGYYTGNYWVESDRIGGEASVSPRDRAPALSLSSEMSAAKSQLNSACNTYAKENCLKFITGELDISDDAVWAAYVEGVKSQSDMDFDTVIDALNEASK